MTLSIIAAVSDNGVIGRDGKIPWTMPRDGLTSIPIPSSIL